MLSSPQRQTPGNSSCCALGQRMMSAPGNTGSSDPRSGWPSERGGRRDVTMGDRLRVYRQKTLPTSREYDLHTPDSQGLPWASLPALRSWCVGGGEGGVVVGGKEAAQRQVRSAQGRRGEGKRHPGGEPGGASDVEKHFLDLAFHG